MGLGLLVTIPFAATEWMNTGNSLSHFPLLLFAALLVLGFLFFFVLIRVSSQLRRKSLRDIGIWHLAFQGSLIVSLAFVWSMMVIDQMPCFLGMANCD